MTIVATVDLRQSMGAVRDQRARPTCLAFAFSSLHESCRRSPEYLSVECLFQEGVVRSHNDPTRGPSLSATRRALAETGQPLESSWPYVAVTSAAPLPRPVGIICRKAHVRTGPTTVPELCTLIAGGKAAVIVVRATTGLVQLDSSGVVRQTSAGVEIGRHHALVAVGLGEDAADSNNQYILVRNSWGLKWGHAGHAWLERSYLGNHLVASVHLEQEDLA
ncbi:MAG: C1 family peptidase [Deltaproteobacteria bacterium]|nr:C1 family peptidase [Deltaproteobacteria bacterium]